MNNASIINGKKILEKNYDRYRIVLTGADKPVLTLCRIDADADGQETITAVFSYDMADIYRQTYNYLKGRLYNEPSIKRI